MAVSNETMVIFVDVQQDIPAYLCKDKNGEFFLCTVEKRGKIFTEQNTKIVSCIEAQIFIANACNKARKIISENS